jgi:hypothetical protein
MPRFAWLRFLIGCGLAVTLLFGLAEVFLQLFPPSDLKPFLGERSGLTGLYKADPDFAVTYRSFNAFAADNARALIRYQPLAKAAADRPVWAMFGNSFIQAPGMLADTARQRLGDRIIFNLGRNEPLCVRFAQIKLLLENGLKPERIFVELMPVDMAVPQPLDSILITSQGALTQRPSVPPGVAGWLVRNSRLALTAWCRCGLQQPIAGFNRNSIHQQLPETLQSDMDRLFAGLARTARGHGVPVTIILIPSHDQVCRGAPFGFQDTLASLARRQGLDVCDVREGFLNHSDKPALFIPDKHFSELGNGILLDELLRHLEESGVYRKRRTA